jgi:hypothetical protein
MTTSTTSLCVDCKTELPEGARKCTKCGSHQGKIRNALVFCSGVAGALALAGSSLTYVLSNWDSTIKTVRKRDSLRVTGINYYPYGSLMLGILNDGDTNIAVREFVFIPNAPMGISKTNAMHFDHNAYLQVNSGEFKEYKHVREDGKPENESGKIVHPRRKDVCAAVVEEAVQRRGKGLPYYLSFRTRSRNDQLARMLREGPNEPFRCVFEGTLRIQGYSMTNKRNVDFAFPTTSFLLLSPTDTKDCQHPDGSPLQFPTTGG